MAKIGFYKSEPAKKKRFKDELEGMPKRKKCRGLKGLAAIGVAVGIGTVVTAVMSRKKDEPEIDEAEEE